MKILASGLLIVVGLLIMLVGVVAILDPEGTNMSDDGDPFGEPPSRVESAVVASVGLTLLVSGSWLGYSWRRERGGL